MGSNGVPWRSRIVGYSDEEPEQLLANPGNWRIHPKPQQDALAGVLREVGVVQNILCNRTTGRVVDGHLRVTLALREHQPTVPVTWVELSEAEEAEILATLDPIAAMAGADAAKLDELLRDVSSGEAAVQAMLESLAAKAGIIPPNDPNAEWQGMPEFEQKDKTVFHSILVHFDNAEDIRNFADLIEQTVTERTKFVWFPAKVRENLKDVTFVES